MKSLTLRIYLSVVAVLLLFALIAAWVAHTNLEGDREMHRRGMAHERYEALGELIEHSLPDGQAPRSAQAEELLELSDRLHIPMALDDPMGLSIVQSPLFSSWAHVHGKLIKSLTEKKSSDEEHDDKQIEGAMGEGLYRQVWADGRVLWLLRPARPPMAVAIGASQAFYPPRQPPFWPQFMPWFPAADLLLALFLLFVAVAAGAWPVAHRLTRRLKLLQQGVEHFGNGQLQQRVMVQGHDEVADLARSFNQAADQIESLIGAHRSLLANASHELRSPLARLKMAVSLMAESAPSHSVMLQQEIHQNIGELDALVEEVLLASRLDANAPLQCQSVDVLGMLAEEVQPFHGLIHLLPASLTTGTSSLTLQADERLLRRAVRNLLENAKRYGSQQHGEVHPTSVEVFAVQRDGWVDIVVQDRGPGVPADQQERIFEPFYRLAGHAEHAGGVGLGLSLVRQIAQRHGGSVKCEPREGGGSKFIISLPAQAASVT